MRELYKKIMRKKFFSDLRATSFNQTFDKKLYERRYSVNIIYFARFLFLNFLLHNSPDPEQNYY